MHIEKECNSPRADLDPDQYPERGLKACLGALQPWTSTHQLKDYSESSIGWIYGTYTFFLFLGGAQFGAILDSHGPLYVVLPGSIGIVLSLIFLSFSQAPRIGFAWAIRIIALKAVASLDFKALKDIKYASATLSVFFAEFAAFIPITYITSYTLHAGFDEQMSYAILVFLNLGAVFGRFLPGLVADHLGRFNVMIVNCLMCSLFTFILWLLGDLVEPDSLGIVISYAILFGFWSGSAISIAPVCISQVCEIQDYGKRVGTTWTLVSFGTLIALPIAGAIQQHNDGEYYGLIIFGGVLYISSTIAFVISRGICKGWAWGIKF
ncbi:Major facilitator superfamily domain, general substrate transporter [Penicillium griseofulvum]|uniref:Major facilitator superfamily domain, general substrate transporter n=1 Tax=Penicillium patulum TaxID=5078 RepID=A0A135LK68_PENPA|nr:Major facilitator superfamily domain, general substrate transporter [Penicillium griseofulvum]KXG49362.1 Major facilitator superfamily domain, general substrate transporter [Penicillium griseofulvum]